MFNVILISKAASSKESNPVPSPIKRRRSWSADRRVWTALKREREPMVTLEFENRHASRIGRTNKAGKSSGTSTTLECVEYGAQARPLKSPDRGVESVNPTLRNSSARGIMWSPLGTKHGPIPLDYYCSSADWVFGLYRMKQGL